MKLKVVSIACVLLLSNAVFAQQDSHIEAAKRLLEVSRSSETVDQVYAQLEPIMQSVGNELGITDDERELFDEFIAEYSEIMRTEFSWARLEPYMIEVYTDVYTEEEINEITAFYESPTGQKFLDKMPQLVMASMQLSQKMMQEMMPKLQDAQNRLQAKLSERRSQPGS